MTTAAAIVGGGRATRMGGQPKHLVVVDGLPIVERQLAVLSGLCAPIFAVSSAPEAWASTGLVVVPDRVGEGRGPLAGIDAALAHLPVGVGHVVCVACDMPYLSPAAVARLLAAPGDADVVVPVIGGRPEPLFARYSVACAPAVAAQLASGDSKVTRFFDRLPPERVVRIDEAEWRRIDPTLRFLHNVNRPGDVGGPADPR